MRELLGAISVAGGLLTGAFGLFVGFGFIFGGQIALAGTYFLASALSFGLIAIALAISGKRQH